MKNVDGSSREAHGHSKIGVSYRNLGLPQQTMEGTWWIGCGGLCGSISKTLPLEEVGWNV